VNAKVIDHAFLVMEPNNSLVQALKYFALAQTSNKVAQRISLGVRAYTRAFVSFGVSVK